MKTLQEYIIEGSYFSEDSYKEYDLGDLTVKENTPGLQKFLDKYGFKPVVENEELLDACRYTRFNPARDGNKIYTSCWYRELANDTYLIAYLDAASSKPKKYTGIFEFRTWGKGTKTKWLFKKLWRGGAYIKSPKEIEELYLENKLDKLK